LYDYPVVINKLLVEIIETQKGLDIINNSRFSLFLYNTYFIGINFNTLRNNNKTQVFRAGNAKLVFLDIYLKTGIVQIL
jgi:hypothetical protein